MHLIVLAGWPCSGKSTAASALEGGDYPVVSMGGALREAIDYEHEDEVWDHAEELRERHGEHGVATACVEPLREYYENGHDVCVLEGSRNPEETRYLEDELGVETVIIWIDADIEDRVTWFSGREGRGEDFEDREDARSRLRERTEREREAGAGQYLMLADLWMTNYQTEADLANKVIHVSYNLEG